jgi:hypothetical protein
MRWNRARSISSHSAQVSVIFFGALAPLKLELAGINWEIYMPWEGVDAAKLETDLYALLA